jgi:tRNA pseudouridine32 synthase/23S rRNA pseudouridine746 synthase
MTPEEMQARILYRDGLMLVIDKPAGLPVHRGPKGGASLEDFFDALRFGLPRPPALAHRLDKETSGCLVLGRHRKALAHLGLLFKHGKVAKTYWAVVEGGPEAVEGVIELPLGRLDATRGWWMKPDAKGMPAVTTWRVMGRGQIVEEETQTAISDSGHSGRRVNEDLLPPAMWGTIARADRLNIPPPGGGRSVHEADREGVNPPPASPHPSAPRAPTLPLQGRVVTWLALEPLTGRTHQLRVHCAAMGWPILGDNIYGTGPRFGGPGLHLHAREVVVPIGKNREPVRVVAPVPAPMRDLLRACGFSKE